MTLALDLAPASFADLGVHGERLAVVQAGARLSYADLARRVSETAARLGATRRLVLIEARNDIDTLVAYLACLAGRHPALLAPADKPAAVASLVAAYDPDVVVRGGAGRERPAGLPADLGPVLHERRNGTRHDLHPDLALLLSTSGSTGSPKLVRLSYDNLAANAESIALSLRIRPDDRAATSLPLHYCYGLSVVNSHLLRGATLVLTDLSVVDPCFWALVREEHVTTFPAVPYTFELLERVGFAEMDLPHLRYVTQAGGRLAPATVRRYAEAGRRRGWDLVVMYGQTEATARMAVLPPGRVASRPETIGLPVPGGSFRIEPVPGLAGDALGGALGGDRLGGSDGPGGHRGVGELVYSGRNVMLGYAETPADLGLGRTVHELRTGDLARMHDDGLYEVVGRLSRFVKIAGLRVDLAAVERIVAEDGVTAAAAGTDERIVLAVEGEHDEALLGRLLAATIGLPRAALDVHVVEAIPRLPNGKPDLPAVLALARAPGREPGQPAPRGDQAARPRAVPTPTHAAPLGPAEPGAEVRRIFAEQLDLTEVDDDATFVSLGGDSLSYVATSLRLEDALGHLPADWHVTPVRELAAARPRRAGLRARLGARLETGIVLRAVAIVLIVGTHAKLLDAPGMAHVLMAVAGFNFARFQLDGDRLPRLRRQLRSLARVVVPAVLFIAFAHAVTGAYSAANIVLLNAVLGPPTWTSLWHFWFVEVLVYVLVGVVVLLAVPWGDRAQRRFPLGFPAALLGAGLLERFEVVDLGLVHPAPVLWLFALGWAVAAARGVPARVALSAVAAVSVPGFFGDPARDAVILAGVLLLTWLPTLPVPAPLHRTLGLLASASLYTYLTHWLVYPQLVQVHPALAVAASLVVGVGYWALVTRAPAALRDAARHLRGAVTRPRRSSAPIGAGAWSPPAPG